MSWGLDTPPTLLLLHDAADAVRVGELLNELSARGMRVAKYSHTATPGSADAPIIGPRDVIALIVSNNPPSTLVKKALYLAEETTVLGVGLYTDSERPIGFEERAFIRLPNKSWGGLDGLQRAFEYAVHNQQAPAPRAPAQHSQTLQPARSRLFISHAVKDGAPYAAQLVHVLEGDAFPCWVAPRDVKVGTPYPGQIVSAIRECSGLIVLVTQLANTSPDVLQEVQRAHNERKPIAAIIVGDVSLDDNLAYFLNVRHHLIWSDPAQIVAALKNVFA